MTRSFLVVIASLLAIGCATGTVAEGVDVAPDGGDETDVASPCADIDTPAACHACSGSSCQANGCYGGYVCDTLTMHCMVACP